MEVKCPKCRFRYDTPVAAGISEVACVCPRCGTPFVFAVGSSQEVQDNHLRSQEVKESRSQDYTLRPQDVGQSVPLPPLGGIQRGGEGLGESLKGRGGRSPRGCLRNCLIVFLLAFVAAVFAVRNCFGDRSYKQAMLEQGINQSLDEFGDGSVISDAAEFVEIHPEPIPEWLEGAWRVETDYGVITITIHGNKIAEESGGEISRGTFYYKKSRLYCDFGDGELAIRKLNMRRKCIDAGDGMLMEKQ